VSYRLEIRPDAVTDIEAAVKWYEAQQADLGADFARTVLAAIESLPKNPLIYQIRERRRNVCWFLPPRFPHRIVYRIRDDLITVFAVLHSARHEREWRRRL
jgi:plasmid stabilization system protein ParE